MRSTTEGRATTSRAQTAEDHDRDRSVAGRRVEDLGHGTGGVGLGGAGGSRSE